MPWYRTEGREMGRNTMIMNARGFTATTIFLFLAITGAAHADVTVRFEEDAPKDRFVITNQSNCTFGRGKLIIDLSPSSRGLLFDTLRGGDGENVAQPVEIASAHKLVATVAPVRDGAQSVELSFRSFPSNGQLVMTVDVDDSLKSGPMGVQMIAGSEMSGARVIINLLDGTARAAVFNSQGAARVPASDCRFN